MKKITVLSLSILAIIQTNAIAADRLCFSTPETYNDFPSPTTNGAVIEVADNDMPNLANTTVRCNNYLPYFSKNVKDSSGNLITSKTCLANPSLVNFRQGYAPLGVFFRGTKSNVIGGKIVKWHWDVTDSANQPVVSYDSFNMAHVFEKPGVYKTKLTITDDKNQTYSTETSVNVWARDGKTYYVDSVVGDDRFNGLSQTPIAGCDVNTATVGTCAGPWKTATKAFAESTKFYNVTSYPNGKYTANATCKGFSKETITKYGAGWFKTYRSNLFIDTMALKNPDGSIMQTQADVCSGGLITSRNGNLRPGDQVLFNKGQTFDVETAVTTLSAYTAKAEDGVTIYNYELYAPTGLASTNHWTPSVGVLYSSYGNGTIPLIQNVGKTSGIMIAFQGVGEFGFSMADLKFNLESSNNLLPSNNRADFMFAPADPINLVLLRTELEKFNQGPMLQGGVHGLFIKDINSFDSYVTHLFTANGAKDIALVRNKFDYSGNHIAYTSNANGFIYGNTFSRPAFGRTALRIDGSAWNDPNRYNWISNNTFLGWIDPRTSSNCNLPFTDPQCRAFSDGKSYNYALVTLSPNAVVDLAMRDTVFKDNLVKDGGALLTTGNTLNTLVENNVFVTLDPNQSSRLGVSSDMSTRPTKNLTIINNSFIELADRIGPNNELNSSIIDASSYDKAACSEVANHTGINIKNNSFYVNNKRRVIKTALYQGKDLNANQLPMLTFDQGQALFPSIVTSFEGNSIYVNPTYANNTLFTLGGAKTNVVAPDKTGGLGADLFYEAKDTLGVPYRVYSKAGMSLLGMNQGNNFLSISDITPDQLMKGWK